VQGVKCSKRFFAGSGPLILRVETVYRLRPLDESPKTTKLYDRTIDQIDLDEIEEIAI